MPPDFQQHFRFLGLKCRDKITGFEGVGSSVCFDLYGCIQTCLTPPHKSDATEPPKSGWYDNNRIEALSDHKVMEPVFLATTASPKSVDRPGGFDKPAR